MKENEPEAVYALSDRRKYLGITLGALGLFVLAAVLMQMGWRPGNPLADLAAFADRVRDELPNYGPLAPVVYILLYAVQIVVAVLPGNGLAFTAGYLFGPFLGSVYSLVGILLGCAIAFLVGRYLGWPLIEKLAPKSMLDGWRNFAAVNSSITWFLIFFAPSPDVVYFIAGLTSISFVRIMVLAFVGRLPGIVLSSYLGANVETLGVQWLFVLIGAMIVLAVLGHWVSEKLQKRYNPPRLVKAEETES